MSSGLPKVNISRSQVDTKLSCTVCYENFNINEPAVQLPCSHFFHDACITTWLQRRNTCPNCRMKLAHEEGELDPSDEDQYSAADEQESFEQDDSDIEEEEEEDFEFDLSIMNTSGEDESQESVILWDSLEDEHLLTSSSDESIDRLSSSSNISVNIAMNVD